MRRFMALQLLLIGTSSFQVHVERRTKSTSRTFPSLYSVKSNVDCSLEEPVEVDDPVHQCRFCKSSFTSRNKLFRHVRSDPMCSRIANGGEPYSQLKESKRQKIALLFQYYSVSEVLLENESTNIRADTPEAVIAGNLLKGAVEESIERFIEKDLDLGDCKVEILKTTQTSVSNLRHLSLGQEKGCAAENDVIVLRFVAPKAVPSSGTDKNHDLDLQRFFLTKLIQSTNEVLKQAVESHGLAVTLLACKLLESDSRLHAERSCTQRVYHYLMPLRWLPGGTQLEKWWIRCEKHESLSPSDRAKHHTSRVQTRPPNDSLLRLKNALRSAESDTVTTPSEGARDAAGRFGTLANKIRRPWHNFADPGLRGNASPNNEPVWRVVDRARLLDLETFQNKVYAVLEFRGDDFMPHQVRRIVGTALAITHEWLPFDAFDLLTRRDVLVQTPLAPMGHLCLNGVRFHFDELRTNGRGIFDSNVDGLVVEYGAVPVSNRSRILEHLLMNLSDKNVQRLEDMWLQELRDTVAPGIRARLGHSLQASVPLGNASILGATNVVKSPPTQYVSVLSQLRNIVSSGRWPVTSVARSSVIRECNENRGSFTVVNPKFRNHIHSVDSDPLPLGNTLFAGLVEAVFDLERSLSETSLDCAVADGVLLAGTQADYSKRPASSHCAINCNAEFTPHVDSGRGAGQSLSMIVGLGDYFGGEIAVEATIHDIRYRPVEFDGWKLRHWTLPFEGERFSLVWFTPEVKGS